MKWWLLTAVVMVWSMVGAFWWWSQEGGVEVKSELAGIRVDIREKDKFVAALEEIGLMGEIGGFRNVRWVLTDKVQDKLDVVDKEREVVYSMGFNKRWIRRELVVKMQYSDELLDKNESGLENMIEIDMLGFAFLIKSGKWREEVVVEGMKEAMEWAMDKALRGENWIEVKIK